MNIFVLDEDPVFAAQYHCDKHVVKMVLETAQILSTISNGPYRPTHHKHPCVLWAKASLANYQWLVRLGLAIAAEYTYRYGKVHKSEAVIRECADYNKLPDIGMTPFRQCMPLHCIRYKDPVAGYREYYMREKRSFCTWKKRGKPEWWKENS